MASSALAGPWNPLRITGTSAPPNLLLLGKVLAAAILATGHYRILPEPFLPFLPGIDLIDGAVFRAALQTTCVLSALALLFNRSFRVCALVLGSCMLLGVVSSKAYYGNNKTFVGLALVLAGLSDFDRSAHFLRWQLALVYFGAALNKLLDPDWQSGLFFDYWAGEKLRNPVFLAVRELLPPLLAGKIMCWGTIVAEFAAALGLFSRRLIPWALWVNVLFQVGLLEFTGNTFTLFFYAMTAITLAFVSWPERLAVEHDDTSAHRGMRSAFRLLDPDGLQQWRRRAATEPDRGLGVADGVTIYPGWSGVRRLMLFSPIFWLGATVLLALAPGPLERRLLVAVVFVAALPFMGPRPRQKPGE